MTAARAVATITTDLHWSRGSELLEMMRHAVGKDGYRNHFAATVGYDTHDSWDLLCGLGLATRGLLINDGATRMFHVSAAGVAALRALYPHKYKRSLKGPR